MPRKRPRRSASAPSRRRKSLEERRIAWLEEHLRALWPDRLTLGIGDDAALWRPSPGHEVALSVDAQAEGTHFERSWLPVREAGYRAVVASASDLAAMGARARLLLVSLLVEPELREREFRDLIRGVRDAALAHRLTVAGGNLSRGPLSITVTSVGEVERGRALRRRSARPGDALWVTGTPGLARLGLASLRRELEVSPRSPLLRPARAAFRRPTARLELGRELAASGAVRAAIDLSDGLGRDLQHLLEASPAADDGSPAGAELEREAFETMPALAPLCRRVGLDPLHTALAGGEDYELLLAAPDRPEASSELERIARRRGVPITRIGRVTGESGLTARGAGGDVVPIDRVDTFDHL